MKITPPRIQKIGAAITMMPHSDALISEAARFAERLGAPLTLIHTASTRAEKAEYLDELASRLAIPHQAHLIEAPTEPAQALLQTAESAGVDLLIAGAFELTAHGRRRFLGPVARQLAERAQCSVLLVAHPRVDSHNFRRLVVITDFSDCAKLACQHAFWLAEKDAAECVHVISIHTVFMQARAELRAPGEAPARTREEEGRLLHDFVGSLPSCKVPVESQVVVAGTGFAACEFADAVEADLLVLPGRNRPGGRVPPMANWALQVVPCSLWIVHEGMPWQAKAPGA